MLRLPQELRAVCSKPHGRLYPEIKEIEELDGCGILASVGDIVTLYALRSGLKPDIILIDRKTERKFNEKIFMAIDELSGDYKTLYAENPAGHLTVNLARAILNATRIVEFGNKVRIIVEGEEDLAVIPLVCILPENSLVIYGQPGKGVVAVKVTHDKKILIHQILAKMERVNDDGEDVIAICNAKVKG
jgi:hypothetical protein